MCVIIDSNIIHKIFPDPTPQFEALYSAIDDGVARIVYGGELTREYLQIEEFRRILKILDQRGAARSVDEKKVEAETKRLRLTNICRSNDHHVIALARVARVRLLCSEDCRLCKDFRDHRLVANPRGNIYRNASHRRLIRTHCCKSR